MKHLFKVRVVVFILSALPLAFLDVSTVTAQFACAPHDNQSLAHFPQFPPVGTSSYIGEVVYQFDNIPDGDEKNQIISALNSWNLSLASTCSGVFFTTTPSQADYGVLAFQNGTLTDGSAGKTHYDYTVGDVAWVVTITFDPNVRLGPNQTDPLFYDPDTSHDHYSSFSSVYKKIALHEIGHSLGLQHYELSRPDWCREDTPTTEDDQIQGGSVMNNACGVNEWANNQAISPTNCDISQIYSVYPCPTPTPTPTPLVGGCQGVPFPNGTCSTGFVNNGGTCDRSFAFQERCADPTGYDPGTCSCPDGTVGGSPIIVDVDNSGFSMTSVENGVYFDLYAASYPLHLSWTSAASTNAFLVLDRNGNGTIDNGQELFGDITPQPLIIHPNGFNALAVYDDPVYGGDGDGAITASDIIFTQLRLWQDTNHNGISEPNELHPLSDFGLASIDLHYRASQRTDDFGNKFYFRAKVADAQGRQLGRWAWDVFLIVKQ